MGFRLISIAVLFCGFCTVAKGAGAQGFTDDPVSPRTSVSYMSTDFVRSLATVMQFDPSSDRPREAHLRAADARFGASPSLQLYRNISLLVEGGVSSRFLLDRSHLFSVDYLVGGIITAHTKLPSSSLTEIVCDVSRPCAFNIGAGVRHVSAYGGDEFMQVEHTPFRIYSRDGYLIRVSIETAYAGGRIELDDDVRGYGVPSSRESFAELWVRPVPRYGVRLGASRRSYPGTAAPYEALYGAYPFRLRDVEMEVRARATRGATPIGYAYGSVENAIGVEFIVR